MSPLLSQLLGFLLALSTAVGCLAYERLVKTYSLPLIMAIAMLFYLPFLAGWLLIYRHNLLKEVVTAAQAHPVSFGLYWVTFITTPLWYYITRKQGVMTGSLYEVKYIVLLALIYVLFGQEKFTLNTAIGTCLAMGSIYFISRH